MWSLNELLKNAVTDTIIFYSVVSPVPARFLKNVNTFCEQHISVVHVVTAAYWIRDFLKLKAQVAVETEYLSNYWSVPSFGKGQTIAYNSSSVSRAALTHFYLYLIALIRLLCDVISRTNLTPTDFRHDRIIVRMFDITFDSRKLLSPTFLSIGANHSETVWSFRRVHLKRFYGHCGIKYKPISKISLSISYFS